MGKKIISSVVYAILAPDLMATFTMTGKSGTKQVSKNRFKDYVKLIELIWIICSAADSTYTKSKFESDLTYKVFKYAYKAWCVLISN